MMDHGVVDVDRRIVLYFLKELFKTLWLIASSNSLSLAILCSHQQVNTLPNPEEYRETSEQRNL